MTQIEVKCDGRNRTTQTRSNHDLGLTGARTSTGQTNTLDTCNSKRMGSEHDQNRQTDAARAKGNGRIRAGKQMMIKVKSTTGSDKIGTESNVGTSQPTKQRRGEGEDEDFLGSRERSLRSHRSRWRPK